MDSASDSPHFKPRDRVLRRLAALGIPDSYLDRLFEGLVDFAKENRLLLPELVSAILPTNEEVAECIHDAMVRSKKSTGISMKSRFRESMLWLQWLMFEADPVNALKDLAIMNVGQRGVCGAVWGSNDIAYRCRTCEHDPTCAICVPCFQNGNHQDHDFSMIYTGGGCCDCGDETAWKRDGFCSRHRGAEKIQPLAENLANSIGPVLDSLFFCWKEKLFFAEAYFLAKTRTNGSENKKVANELTFAVVEVLLEFCACSESLLSFISKRVIATVGLLDILVRAEKFLIEAVSRKLHELLLKLLGEPVFKYEFSKSFLCYYPDVISDAIKEFSDDALKRYPLLSTFSVQIFTVPTLTPRLVKEMNLLEMLFGCLGDIFVSCAGEDGHLKTSKWGSLFETSNRVLGDIRFVMSHDAVAKYATHDQLVISRTWLKLLTFVQGMNPIKRETGLHIEEENESMHLLFVLGHSISNIHSAFIEGAFSSDNAEETDILSNMQAQEMQDGDGLRHAKVGKLSEESSIGGLAGRSSALSTVMKVDETDLDSMSHLLVPAVVKWLLFECLHTLENWLGVHDGASSSANYAFPGKPGNIISSREDFIALKRTLSKFLKGKYIFGRLSGSSEDHTHASLPKSHGGSQSSGNMEDDSNSSSDTRMAVISPPCSVASASADSDHTTEMEGDVGMSSDALHILSLSEWPDIMYDVSSQEISLHIPLHRLLSLLLQKALRCFGESTGNTPLSGSSSSLLAMKGEFFGHTLRGCQPYGFAAFVMEHPLRIRVFCAQVNAGMWRKNGDVALVAAEWYRSVRWSEQGLELDLFLLQCCAALAPPDNFLIRILNRFGLSSYLSMRLERSSEYEPVLVQEMLTLIMQILQERRFCGLTVTDSLERELIYKLAIGDCTHSQLVKSLPRDLSKCDQLQEIITKVALYSNPSGLNQGMYLLRMQYWKELDLYHPRWNSRDLQVAQERYSRFCGVSALITQLPSWTKIHPPLEGIAGLATCRVMLQIIRAVLFYAVFADKAAESRAPDGILIAALHLLSLTLDICVQQRSSDAQSYCGDLLPLINFACEDICEAKISYGVGEQSLLSLLVILMRLHIRDNQENFSEGGNCSFYPLIENLIKKFAEIDHRCMCKLRQLAPEVVDHFYPTQNNYAVPGSPSDSDKRKVQARERQAAILEKMKAEQSKFLSTIGSDGGDESVSGAESASDVEDDTGNTLQDVCSLCHDSSSKNPVSFLILLQKSRLLSFIDKGRPAWDSVPKENTSVLRRSDQFGASASSATSGWTLTPAEYRSEDAINGADSEHVQRRDVKTFLEFIRSRFASVKSISASRLHRDVNETTPYNFETLEEDLYTCIYQEMCDKMQYENVKRGESASISKSFPESSTDAEPILLEKFVSGVPKNSHESESATASTYNPSDWALESASEVSLYDGFGPAECDGIYISSCGHGVHQSCLERYLSSLRERYVRRNIFEGAHIVDPDQGEFLCPVCRRLANSVLPAVPGSIQMATKKPVPSPDSSSGPFYSRKPDEMFPFRLQQAFSLLQYAAYVVGRPKILEALPLQRKERPIRNLDLVIGVLSKMYFSKKQDRFIASSKLNHSIILWDTLKYSLMSTEVGARGGKSSMNPNYSLKSLFKEFRSSSEFILSLLLKVVQSTRKTNSSHVLQRFRGLQLFMQSICFGVSFGECELGDSLVTKAPRRDDIEASYPDIQLWNRASDPIIARDPFSSLMWVVFCLPCPFLSCKESLVSLIHLFYAVSTVQALITYCGQYRTNIDKVDPESLVMDTYRMVGEFEYMSQYFVTSYIEASSANIKELVRRWSFPYLRRCALLWKLLNSSVPTPVFEQDNMWDSDVDMMNASMDVSVELSEVQDLENMFEIPSIDVLLQNGMLRSLASKWFHHFRKEHEGQRFQSVLHCNPAVPFKLMNLPHIYHDLLQRYIKQSCPDCKAALDEPALCLLCGRLCSPGWKPCCSQSGCLPHAMACGAGIGVFLLIRRTTILLQRSARQAPWPSPYLDAFGEEDVEMHRGKPLYLNEERYAALSYMVASHGLDRSSKVLGQTTIGTFFLV